MPKRWTWIALTLAALVGAGCGGGTKTVTVSPTILDTEKVERAIEDSAKQQRGVRPRVSCPAGVAQQRGNTFRCVAVVGKRRTTFVVQQVDDGGNVTYAAP